jgi:carboxyl-terminal processing protease
MKRARIEVPVVLGSKRQPEDQRLWDYWVDPDSKIGYVRLTQFTDHTAPELKKALESLQKDGAKGFVLDMRDNPGGLLVSAIEVSDLFLTAGKIVSTKDRHGLGRSWDAKEEGTFFQPAGRVPMAVIVNRNSASAAELVAAALQDNGRAVVVGERSFGKGSVQKVFEIGLDAQPMALKLTTETYWRPSGKNIHRFNTMKDADEWGVSPDAGFEVKLSDEQRLEYLKARRARDTVRGKNAATKPDADFKDLMLDKAVEAVKGKMGK